MPAKPKPEKIPKPKTPRGEMKGLYRSLVKANGRGSATDHGVGPMTYLGDGVWLKSDGTMYSE